MPVGGGGEGLIHKTEKKRKEVLEYHGQMRENMSRFTVKNGDTEA